jgi:MFS family permease
VACGRQWRAAGSGVRPAVACGRQWRAADLRLRGATRAAWTARSSPGYDGCLTADVRLLFGTRITRLFAYGFLSVVLVLYLVAIGFGAVEIGAILSLTLVGDAAISLWLTTHADRIGRRRVLLAGAGLMVLAAAAFAVSRDLWVLILAATIGVISPSGNEVGPFLAVEQAALAQAVADDHRTRVFGWYALAGSFATASGSLAAGFVGGLLQATGSSTLDSYRAIIVGYGVFGIGLAVLFSRLSSAVEVAAPVDASVARRLGLHRSRGVVARLSALFALDAFAGGFVIQSIVSYWLHTRFGLPIGALGGVFFGANVLAGLSALAAAPLARRVGLVNTMVFTHLPSNILLILVPLMPSAPLAVGLLLARFSISQMDVPTRQSYTMAVVDPDERSAAAGVTGIARSVGAAVSPSLATPLVEAASLAALPFVIAGTLKIGYDLLLYRSFRAHRPPEEARAEEARAGDRA